MGWSSLRCCAGAFLTNHSVLAKFQLCVKLCLATRALWLGSRGIDPVQWSVYPVRSKMGRETNFYSLKLTPVGKMASYHLTLSKEPDIGAGEGDADTAVQEDKPKLKRPPMYKVVMFNDDFTPMEFVVEVLETFFAMNREKATQVMIRVHTQGKAVCGVYTRDIAETKAAQVNECAKENEHPLLCEIEAVEDDEDR